MNWGFSPPPDGGACECSEPDNGEGDGDPPDPQCGSVIGCQSQSLGERLAVTGTPFELHYQSENVLGYKAGRTLRIYADSPGGPATAPDRIDVEITVAGQRHVVTRPGVDPDPIDFTWDGLDAFGRQVYGRFPARVRVDYIYQGRYERVARFGYRGNGLRIEGSQTRREVTFPEIFETSLEVWDARGQGLGGWTLDQHHTYDPVGRVLHLGSGEKRSASTAVNVIKSVTTSATSPGAWFSAVGPDGTLYFTTESQVRKVAPDGTVSTIAGSAHGYGGDGQLATIRRFAWTTPLDSPSAPTTRSTSPIRATIGSGVSI